MEKLLFILSLILSLNLFGQNCPATFICTSHNATPNGFGVQELSPGIDGCLSGEHNSTWLTITIATSGTLTFTVNPIVNTNDFDYAVWGPNSPCPPTNQPIRCSYAVQAGNGNTGLNNTATDNSEGVFGDQWTQQLNVIAGQTYLILVDNFTTNSGFDITFGGTATLNCTPLPIVLLDFGCLSTDASIIINWSTESESNNWKFEIQRSTNGINWETIGTVYSQNPNSSQTQLYSFTDVLPLNGINYYRLNQVDFNGQSELYGPINCEATKQPVRIYQYYNLLGQEIVKPNSGVFIEKTIIGDIIQYKTIYLNE